MHSVYTSAKDFDIVKLKHYSDLSYITYKDLIKI